MRFTSTFTTKYEALAFTRGLRSADDGSIHSVEIKRESFSPPPVYVVHWNNESRKPAELPEDNPPVTPAAYVKRKGCLCPVCRGEDFEGHSIEVAGGNAYQPITCNNPDCEASWVACYELSGYDNLER